MILFSFTFQKYFKTLLAFLLLFLTTFWEQTPFAYDHQSHVVVRNTIVYCYMAFIIWDCRLFNIRFVVFAMCAGATVLILSRWLIIALFRIGLLDQYPGLEIIVYELKEALVYGLIAFSILGRNSILNWYKGKDTKFTLEYRMLTGIEHLILFGYFIVIFWSVATVIYFSYHQFIVGIEENGVFALRNKHSDWFQYDFILSAIYAIQFFLLQAYHFKYLRKRWLEA